MRYTNVLLSVLFCAAASAAAPAAKPRPPAPIEVMVLGSYHFANPGLDVVRTEIESVLSPRRQRELDVLTRTLAEWRPTRVMVEGESDAADLADPGYATFTPDVLTKTANERVQIGYRLARQAGLATVEAIDEQPKAGEPDYFPFDKLSDAAASHGQKALVDGAFAQVQTAMKRFEADQGLQTIPALLERFNDPASPLAGNAGYYAVLPVGDNDAQAGADFNAMWYLRNAKIFAKLMHVAKPGDRVVVLYGAGHFFWLRHFASQTPGYQLVDARPFLARAAAALGKPAASR